MEYVIIRMRTGLYSAFTGDICFSLYPCRKPPVNKITHVPCIKLVHINYSNNCTTIKRRKLYKYELHVSAYSGHLKGVVNKGKSSD
jgi:hypothetical protein